MQLRTLDWTPQEAAVLYPLFLITMKPVLFVATVADSDPEDELAEAMAKFVPVRDALTGQP